MGRVIEEFFWKGGAVSVGDLFWPALPGWSLDELCDVMPGGVPAAMRLPGDWWHGFLHVAEHQQKYQAKIVKTQGVLLCSDDLPDESHDTVEYDEVGKSSSVVKRSLSVLSRRNKYQVKEGGNEPERNTLPRR